MIFHTVCSFLHIRGLVVESYRKSCAEKKEEKLQCGGVFTSFRLRHDDGAVVE